MALDKQSIERHDFPVGRRGYDQSAVDTHLSWLASAMDSERASVAAEVEELKRAHGQEGTLASTASEHVRAIIAAAESSAAEITSAAQADAQRVRDRADAESRAARERAAQRAAEQAQELVDKVSAVTAGMLERIGAMESELGSVTESVRSGRQRLAAELERLHSYVSDVAGLYVPEPGSTSGDSTARPDIVAAEGEPEAEPDVRPLPLTPRAQPSVVDAGALGDRVSAGEIADGAEGTAAAGGDHVPADEIADGAEGTAAAAGDRAPSSDVTADEADGARLIALNMALTGRPRQETALYLEENFTLPDADRLLDDVYDGVDSRAD